MPMDCSAADLMDCVFSLPNFPRLALCKKLVNFVVEISTKNSGGGRGVLNERSNCLLVTPKTSLKRVSYTHLEQNEQIQQEEIKKFDYAL